MVPFDCAQGRLPHHERGCSILNSSTYPFALSVSKGSERMATLWEKKARMRVHEIKTLTSISPRGRGSMKEMEMACSQAVSLRLVANQASGLSWRYMIQANPVKASMTSFHQTSLVKNGFLIYEPLEPQSGC